MLSFPKKSTATAGNDLSSICNFADISPQSCFTMAMNEGESPANSGITPKSQQAAAGSNLICNEAFVYRDEAIPFITVKEETKQFEVHPEAAKLLESIEGELGVVTIAGPYRTGKSSLAGRALLDNPKAFQSAPTVNPCTKGLWIYARPITDCKTVDGEQVTAVVIDSEGLNALDESQNHDLRIMTLSVLLSSKLIYNSMNAIDEQSLSQLNLVVNLTKQIQLRSSNAIGEFQDPDELAKIFPSFLWLVRDFNLALVNQEGETITSKEYLEISLQEQNGMSERTEMKNRTRRVFKSLFTERDCLTFDRPIGEEAMLQNLQDLPNDQLKPNFVRQLETLKKRVLCKMQTKTVHGKTITGRVLVNLARQYVQAFNTGQVPNIESAWTYICQNESMKALAQARNQFKNLLEVKITLPCSLFDLECDYKEAKKEAFKVYHQGAINDADSTKKGELRLKQECRQIFEQVKMNNDEKCTIECTQYLNQYHGEIMASLSNNCLQEEQQTDSNGEARPIFKDINQVESALHQIEQTFDKSGPAGDQSMRKLIYEKFRSQIAFESGLHFIQSHKRDGQASIALLEAKSQNLQKDLVEAKKGTQAEIESLQAQVRNKERENFDLKAMKEITEQKLTDLEALQTKQNEDYRSEFETEKQKLQNAINEAQLAKEVAEADLQRVQRSMVEVTSRAEREKALCDQEIAHLKAQEIELRKRESELNEELKKVAMSNADQRKERESEIQQALNLALKEKQEANEKVQDLQEQLDNAKQQLEQMQLNAEQKEQEFRSKLSATEKLISTKSDQQNQSKLQQMLDEAKKSLEDVTESLQVSQNCHKTEISQLNTEKDSMLAQNEKKIAILIQKEAQQKELIDQLQNQIESSKADLDSMMSQLHRQNEGSNQGLTEQKALVDSLQKTYQDELKSLIESHDKEKLEIQEELNQANQKLEEECLKSKVKTAELQKQLEECDEQIKSLEIDNQNLQKQYKAQRDRNENIIESMHSKSSQSVVELTQQHEMQIRELEETINETQEQAKQELTKLKITFEKEKDQVTQKWQEDKLKLKAEEEEMRQDYETRINDDEQKFDEERQFLQSQLSQIQYESKAQLDKVSQEFLLLRNDHDNLIVIHNEKLEQLKTLQESSASNLQAQLRSHNEQITNLQGRIDIQTTQLTTKEQALITANLSLETTKNDLGRKKAQISSMEETQKTEIERLETKINSLRQDNQSLKDEVQAKKMECSREIALKEQSIEFLEKKIVEQQSMSDTRLKELEEQMSALKIERNQQLSELTDSFNEQRNELEQKFESRRKALKALQTDFNQKVPELERRNTLLTSQIESIERQAREKEQELQQRIEQTSSELQTAHEQAAQDLRLSNQKAEKIKARVLELEKENASLQNEMEKDKALFEDKAKFLTEQKVRLEAEKSDTERRLKDEQDNLQRMRGQEKEKAAKNRQECVTHLETYYKQLTQRIQEEGKKAAEDAQMKTKQLQETNQDLTTQLEIVKRERDNNLKASQERLDKQDRIEANLRQDLVSLKKSHEATIQNLDSKYEQLKETSKAKVAKSEKERKEMELTHTTLRNNFSIEEAKWNMKSDQFQNDIRQLNEEVERLQKKNETLLRENQMIRTSNRNQLHQSMGGYQSNRSQNFLNSTAQLKFNSQIQMKEKQDVILESTPSQPENIVEDQKPKIEEKEESIEVVVSGQADNKQNLQPKPQPQQKQTSNNESNLKEDQKSNVDGIAVVKTQDKKQIQSTIKSTKPSSSTAAQQKATTARHVRSSATANKVVLATFSAKASVVKHNTQQPQSQTQKNSNNNNTVLSRKIRESMARCSPTNLSTFKQVQKASSRTTSMMQQNSSHSKSMTSIMMIPKQLQPSSTTNKSSSRNHQLGTSAASMMQKPNISGVASLMTKKSLLVTATSSHNTNNTVQSSGHQSSRLLMTKSIRVGEPFRARENTLVVGGSNSMMNTTQLFQTGDLQPTSAEIRNGMADQSCSDENILPMATGAAPAQDNSSKSRAMTLDELH